MRRLALAAVLLLAPALAQAKTVTEWTLDVLRQVVQWPQPPELDGGKFKAVILYREDLVRANQMNRPLAGLDSKTEQVGGADDEGLYEKLIRLHNTNHFHCVILTDLLPDQVIAAEHFARATKVALIAVVSRRPAGGGIPFAFDPVTQVAFVRHRALRHYGLDLQSMPPKVPMVLLDTEDAYKDVDRCVPALDPSNTRANPEVVCHDNAFATIASKNRDDWEKAVRNLDVALLHVFEEAKDHKKFRGWGREAYHPHIGLIEYLLKFRNCSDARRELPYVDPDRRDEMDKHISGQCASVAPHVASGGIPSKPDWSMVEVEKTELLPPFRPQFDWSELFSLP
jgi:hypothetical protein